MSANFHDLWPLNIMCVDNFRCQRRWTYSGFCLPVHQQSAWYQSINEPLHIPRGPISVNDVLYFDIFTLLILATIKRSNWKIYPWHLFFYVYCLCCYAGWPVWLERSQCWKTHYWNCAPWQHCRCLVLPQCHGTPCLEDHQIQGNLLTGIDNKTVRR